MSMTTAADVLARASGRTRTVWVCPDAELYSRWQEAEADYQRAKSRQGGTLGDTGDTAELREIAERLRDEVDGSLVQLELSEVRPGRLRALQAEHAMSKQDAARAGLKPGSLNEATFWPALAAEAITEPQFTVEQASELLDISATVRGPLVQALNELHGQVGDPKAAVATARTRSGGSS